MFPRTCFSLDTVFLQFVYCTYSYTLHTIIVRKHLSASWSGH